MECRPRSASMRRSRHAPRRVSRRSPWRASSARTAPGSSAAARPSPAPSPCERGASIVEPQIRRAANESLQSADWVLDISSRDDLSLEGSPEQIRKQLVASYKTDYANAWKGFMQGIAITPSRTSMMRSSGSTPSATRSARRLWRCFAASTNRPPGTAPASSMPGWSVAARLRRVVQALGPAPRAEPRGGGR